MGNMNQYMGKIIPVCTTKELIAIKQLIELELHTRTSTKVLVKQLKEFKPFLPDHVYYNRLKELGEEVK